MSGDRRVTLQRRRVTVAVEKVLRARGKMLRNKDNGLADCIMTEMLQCLRTETRLHIGSTSGRKENVVPQRFDNFTTGVPQEATRQV